jgi:hypothetical protein
LPIVGKSDSGGGDLCQHQSEHRPRAINHKRGLCLGDMPQVVAAIIGRWATVEIIENISIATEAACRRHLGRRTDFNPF